MRSPFHSWFLPTFSALFAFTVIGAGTETVQVRVRVLTYNIHHGEGVDGVLDLNRIAGVIRSVEPDLVALQEVDRNTTRTENVDQAQRLSELTELKVVFGANIQFQGGQYGNAVLSRFPIRQHRNWLLPKEGDGEQRGVLDIVVDVPGMARPLRFLATHWDHRRDDRERLLSAETVNRWVVEESSAQPGILAGDLNAVPSSEVLKIVERAWVRSNDRVAPTIPVGSPVRQIDYVLFRPADSWRVVEWRVLPEAVASDHRAFFAVLERTSE